MIDCEPARAHARLAAVLAGISLVALGTSSRAEEVSESVMQKLERMESRIRSLEAQLAKKDADAAARKPAATPARPGGMAQVAETAPPAAPPAGKDADAAKNADAAKEVDAAGPKPAAAPARPNRSGPAPAAGTAPPAATAAATAAAPAAAPGVTAIPGLVDTPVAGLSIGAYGELRFGAMQNPAAGGQWQNGFDAARMVLLPTYQITDNIIFNAEIEFEHAGSGFDADDKLHGTAEIEQVWVDFKIVDQFNWRAPGIDLIPIGYINQHHEPTQFYSVLRPELYNGLIPSTWKAPATSVYGRIAEGLSYQIQASSSVEDFGGDFATRTAANTVPPFPAQYPPGIDGRTALEFSLPVRGGFAQLNDAVAIAGKLDYSPPLVPGLSGSTSVYWTPNTTPRGAYAVTGAPLGTSSLTMLDSEFRYRVPKTGLELRGEAVYVTFGNPANLRANNDGDPTDNVGKSMYGWSGEVAYHFALGTILGSEWEAVPFYRYTYQNLQTAGFAGVDPNQPTGAGQTQFHTLGVAVFPSPKLVLKATYEKVINRDPGGAQSDSMLGGVGFFF